MSNSVHKVAINDLTKTYGTHRGVENLNLNIEHGEIFGFLGPNGAGKTTTIRLMLNILIPNSGQILIDGTEVTRDSSFLKEDIGYLPGEYAFPKGYTVERLLKYIASLKSKPSFRMQEIIDLFDLDTSRKIHALSQGNKQKLGIVLAFMHDPDLIILDEPTAGLDPLYQQKLYDLLREEKANGKTIFFSSHNLDEVQKICDRVGIIRNGRLIAVEKVKDLASTVPRKLEISGHNLNKKPFEAMGLRSIASEDILIVYVDTKKQLSEVLHLLAEMHIDDLSYPPASLEEYFLLHYNDGVEET